MRSEFKAKLIQHMLNKKGSEKGFTLIELLVVIIIIGILAAIALPSFLNQANKARQSEARTYVGSINRAQQAYFLEKQQYAPNLINAAVGIPAETPNYGYGINRGTSGKGLTGQFAVAFGLPFGGTAVSTAAINVTSPDSFTAAPGAPVKAYVGVTNIVVPATSTEAASLAVLCEANQAGVTVASTVLSFATNAAVLSATNAAPVCNSPTNTSTGFSPIS